MASWSRVHAINETRSAVVPVLVQEDAIQYAGIFDPSGLDPSDYRVVFSAQTYIVFQNGTKLFLTESPAALVTLLAAKG